MILDAGLAARYDLFIMSNKIKLKCPVRAIRTGIERHIGPAVDVARGIWKLAEPPTKEYESADLLENYLGDAGFKIDRPWPRTPTAFRATIGKAGPKIGFLAEYDALPDCGAKHGKWGHGCGHNLLGVASALAGIVTHETLTKLGKDARIIVYGTPAEETLAGKVFMAEDGAFGGLDACMAWHPAHNTAANLAGGLAMDSLSFYFRGRTAHAGGRPHAGRSALDAAILTDVAANYLREHIEDNARIHCVLPDAGSAPNVVPDTAEIWYYVRGRDRKQVDDLRRRLTLCAKGAAMATETKLKTTVHTAVTERMQNETLAEILDSILNRYGAPKFTPAETRSARKVIPGANYDSELSEIQTIQGSGSSDEDNVSWFAPMGRLNIACVPKDTTSHHTTFAKLSDTAGAYRGMKKAAEIMAAGAAELICQPALLKKAKVEFKGNKKGKKYDLPISANAVPPAYRV